MRAGVTYLALSLVGCSLEVTIPDLGEPGDQAVDRPLAETGLDAPPLDGPGQEAAPDARTIDGPPPPFTISFAVSPSSNPTHATCKSGIVVGGGASCPKSSIERSYPHPTKEQWISECYGDGTNQATVVICVDGVTSVTKSAPPVTFLTFKIVTCPIGHKPVGGGCWCDNRQLENAFPDATETGWHFQCDDSTGPGSHLAMLYCIDPKQAAIYWERVPGKVAVSPNISTIKCPPKTKMIGGGCETKDEPRALKRSTPDPTVSPAEFVCQAEQGSVQAWAICVSDNPNP